MTITVYECEQGTPEWFEARRGIATASEFAAIIAEGRKKGEPSKMRRSYLLRLAAERLTEERIETYTNAFMDRGKTQEDEARDLYAFLSDEPLTRIGFVRNGDVGCSPDALVGDDGVLEIKTQRADLLIDSLLDGRFPSEYRAQCQGALWVTGRKWVDICLYAPKMPPLIRRAGRDDTFIADLAKAVEAFNAELAETVERIRNYAPAPSLKASLAASVEAV